MLACLFVYVLVSEQDNLKKYVRNKYDRTAPDDLVLSNQEVIKFWCIQVNDQGQEWRNLHYFGDSEIWVVISLEFWFLICSATHDIEFFLGSKFKRT